MNFNEIGLKDLVLDFDSNDLQDITIVQGDTKTRGFKVLVSTNNGEIIKASNNYEMRLYGVNSNYPDKSFFTKGVIEGDFYKVYISTDMASKSGKLQLQLALFEGTNALIQSRIKEVDVYRSIANGGNVGKDLVVDFGKLNKVVEIAEKQQKKFEESLVRQQAVESKISQKHTEVVQIRDGLKDVLTTENARVEAEKKRVSAEIARQETGQNRNIDEKVRQSHETAREEQESTRQTQEKQRQANESTRKSEEQKRITAETNRDSEEQKRISAEKQRASNEDTRQTNEKIRVSQENARVEAEKKRQNIFDTWDKTMKNVIESEHLHIAYADSEDGSVNFSKKEANRKFIGQYVDYEEKGSDDYTKYKWSLIKGADGVFTGEIGARNLIKNSDDIDSSCFVKIDGGKLSFGYGRIPIFDYLTTIVTIEAGNQTDVTKGMLLLDIEENLIEGKTYTFSMYVQNRRSVPMKFNVKSIESDYIELKPNETKRIIVTGKKIEDTNANGKFRVFINANTKGEYIKFAVVKPQLEEGDVATSWGKNPSDFKDDISNLKTQIYDKANKKHTHNISEVNGLKSELDKKASTSDLTNVQKKIDGKSDLGHYHVMSSISNLETTLEKKVSSDTVKNIAIIEKGASTTSIPANTLIFEKE